MLSKTLIQASKTLLESAEETDAERGGASSPAQSWLPAWLHRCSAKCSFPLSSKLAAVLVTCSLVIADLGTDFGQALPQYLAHDLIESFEIQLTGIIVGAFLGYMHFVMDVDLFSKLSRFPVWLKTLAIFEIGVCFPFAPAFIIFAALGAYKRSDAKELQFCLDAARAISAGEFLEASSPGWGPVGAQSGSGPGPGWVPYGPIWVLMGPKDMFLF